ncbi:hypothetical protein [Halorubrum sp. SD626R]|uniref:hypothetical protein n=1 Tax=Halorubrum sp. SD626R TaxID=1419722 RepID=UPI0018EE6AB8|nr:hypothetical protein [Halorubrum sp. SD626R]
MNDAIDRQRSRLDRRLDEPDRLRFPDGWTMSTSWQRAQAADGVVGSTNPAEWDVLLGSGDCHRVLFAVYDGHPRAECDCDGWQYHDWCAHVARLWWRWVRGDLVVADLDTGARYTTPPEWIRVDDADAPDPTAEPAADAVRADGGGPTHAESARARTIPSRTPTGGRHTDTDSSPESTHGAAIDRVIRDGGSSYVARGIGGDRRER